jgi:uncharacterized protein (DUF1684 family)
MHERLAMSVDHLDQTTYVREWTDWHVTFDQARFKPHGFLAITGLHWLSDEPARFSDARGEWRVNESGVRVVLRDGETLIINGEVVRDAYDFGVLEEDASVFAEFDDAKVQVAKRGERYVLRPRHPDHELLQNFNRTPTFAPDLQWVSRGRFVALPAPERFAVDSVVEGYFPVYDAVGHVEFELQEATYRVLAFRETESDGLLVLFRDATSGLTTSGSGRELELDAPDDNQQLLVDFNRATNLWCAYTDFATCPLPPAENRLPIAIEAGEQIPRERQRD